MQHESPIQARLNSRAGLLASNGLVKSCVTELGQKYVLYGTQSANRGDSGYELWMLTANARNIEVLSQPIKLSTESMDQMQISTLMDACERHFASYPPPSLSCPPPSCVIPVNCELISFSLVDLLDGAERLFPGDEVFVSNYLSDGRIWYHSGIYVGGGCFCHFVPTNGFNETDLNSRKTVPGVVKCVTTLAFYEAVPSTMRRQAFRVTHPILVREGLTIVDQAKRMINEKLFNDYNYVNRNCQHFSSHCSYDREFSYNTDKLFASNGHAASQKVAAVAPMVRPSFVTTESCLNSSVKGMQQKSNRGNYEDRSQYIGGPMAQFEHTNKPSNVVSQYCGVAMERCLDSSVKENQHNSNVSKYGATFEMPDSEYFAL